MNISSVYTFSVFATVALGVSACLDPLVVDELGRRAVLDPGAEVPDGHDNTEVEQQIAKYDGVEGIVPLVRGFAGGASAQYWDFGETPEFTIPLFALVRKNDMGELVREPHNTIIDSIPGDEGYSPYWALFYLEVTDLYNGEIIPSFGAVEEAQRLGLVKTPVHSGYAVNCPVVSRSISVDVGNGGEPLPPPSQFYWRGVTIHYYDFGRIPLQDTKVPIEKMYVLNRQGELPLSEPLRGIDFTGDTDIVDTNNVFTAVRTKTDYSPLVHRVEVTVVETYSGIDTAQDDSVADATTANDLFTPEPTDIVLAFKEDTVLLNLPQQQTVGAL